MWAILRIETNLVVKAMLAYKIIKKKVVFISIKCLLYLLDQLGLDRRNLKYKPHTTYNRGKLGFDNQRSLG